MTHHAAFQEVFDLLKLILSRHEKTLAIKVNTEQDYSLDTHHVNPSNKTPIFFGAVQIKKNYVSFHLMPIYACPDLLEGMSPELKKRMQGKSCFQFKKADKTLFKELEKLTESSLEKFRKKGWV